MLITDDALMLDEFLKLVVEPLYEKYHQIKQEKKSKKFFDDSIFKADNEIKNDGEVMSTSCEHDENDNINSLWIDFFDEEDDDELKKIINEVKQYNYFSKAKRLYNIQNCFYPSVSSGIKAYDFRYPIITMAEFLILLPLCEWSDVLDIANRVDSSILEREDYILEQINGLYKRVPDSPEKRYITHQIFRTRCERKSILNEGELWLKKEMDEYEKTMDYWADYFAYRDLNKEGH